MGQKTKRNREMAKLFDAMKSYSLEEAIDILKQCPPVKFDQTVDIVTQLGVDPRKSDQGVRGAVSLPNGTGRTLVVLVFAKGDKVQEALNAGADYAGSDELIEKVAAGWTDFDAVIATPEMMREVGKLGKVLGPRSLMPTPKAGTVTADVKTAVKEVKAGKIEFKVNKAGVVSNGMGKLSFSKEQLKQNIRAFLTAVQRAKPASAKGVYFRTLYLSSTMGPGLRIDLKEIDVA